MDVPISGFCVWLTGLSGAGKSTIAGALKQQLDLLGCEAVVFDGDAVRSRLAAPLGYGREDRNANVRRVAVEAAEVVKAGQVAICALMSPFAESRREARDLIGPERFVLVHVSTPLGVCEGRDTKGLYARARRGEIHHVIGVDEAYEIPADADLHLDTTETRLEVEVQTILGTLARRRVL